MKTAVRAAALPTLLDRAPAGIQCLSLDCFDTLIWRNVNMPVDVFADLPLAGGGLETRMWAEKRARRAAPFKFDRNEVTLPEIYDFIAPTDPAECDALVATELAAEAKHCFAFAPTRDLILDAKRRGLMVMIVSDTYLREPELRGLIEAVAGKPLADMIDRIFCSCEYGEGKADGLFLDVLAQTGLSPSTILHVGDNKTADQDAPTKLGINTVHLEQFDGDTEQRLRLEAVAAALVAPQTRVTLPVHQPHRALLSLRQAPDATYALGHDVLGPIMHGFASWIHDEAKAIEARSGKAPKLLFLLRDGHLPKIVYDALHPEDADRSLAIELSRFTAGCAAFVDEAAIERFLLPELTSSSLEALAKQLLFNRHEIEKLTQDASIEKFAQRVRRPENIAKILSRSRRFADRLFAYLRRQGVNDGDAVMLVDLGYNGTVQNLVEPALVQGMKLDVAGRYMLLREVIRTGLDKTGWFDVRNYDAKLLHALSESIAIVEQFATLAQGSVVDYREDGTSVRAVAGLKDVQSECRDRGQAACIDFARNAGIGFVRPPVSDDADSRRGMAIASLARLLFLPLSSEVEVLKGFHHDVNMGTNETVQVVDPEAAGDGLRRRGLFYAKNAMRLYLPGELQSYGLQLNLSILSARRFGLDLRKSDFEVGAIKLPVMLMDAEGHLMTEIDAFPTDQGYYQAMIPVGNAQYVAGVQFGNLYDWVQIEEASFHYIDEFMKTQREEQSIDAHPLFESMEEVAGGLYRCNSDAGFMMVPPPGMVEANRPLLLNVVFRPLLKTGAAQSDSLKKVA